MVRKERKTGMSISPRDRVRAALEHRDLDRVPRGELLVEEGFLDKVYPEMTGCPWRDKMRRMAADSDLDLVTIGFSVEECEEKLKEITWWSGETGFFTVVLLDGVFWHPKDPLSFENFLLGLHRDRKGLKALIESKRTTGLYWVDRCLDSGADGCIIADDIAYNRGPFVSLSDLKTWFFPGLQEIAEAIKAKGGAAFLHSCGNLTSLIDPLCSLGFDGIHGLSRDAGNDLLEMKREIQGRMTLFGGFDIDNHEPREIRSQRETVLSGLSKGGGYILGSSAGLSKATPLDSFSALYAPPEPTGIGT